MSRSREQTLATSYSRKLVSVLLADAIPEIDQSRIEYIDPRRTVMFISAKPFDILSDRAERWSCKIDISAANARPDRKLVRNHARTRALYKRACIETLGRARASDYTEPGKVLTTPTP